MTSSLLAHRGPSGLSMGEMSERQRNLIEDALEIEQRDAKKAVVV